MELVLFLKVGEKLFELLASLLAEHLVALVWKAGPDDDAVAAFGPGSESAGPFAGAAVGVDADDEPAGFSRFDAGRGIEEVVAAEGVGFAVLGVGEGGEEGEEQEDEKRRTHGV